MGHAFESILNVRHQLSIWSRRLEQHGQCVLESQVNQAEIIIFCLPVMAHKTIARRIASVIASDTICLTIAKGLDEQARPAYTILQQELPRQPVCAIYGPMIAEELISFRPGFGLLATSDISLYQQLAPSFQNSHLFLQLSHDLLGSSWSVILKNVYALLIGISDRLQLGDNMRGLLMVKAL